MCVTDLDYWIWINIMDIYLDFGKNNHAKFNGLLIHSNDNYFDCHIEGMSNRFRIVRHNSYVGGSVYSFLTNTSTHSNIFYTRNAYVEKLRFIFRDYRLEKLLEDKK